MTDSPNHHKIFCLLSGGVDSTTTLGMATMMNPGTPVEAVTFDYGQRHKKELESAAAVSEHFQAAHTILQIPPDMVTGMLVDKGDANEAIPNVDYADLPKGISPTYVSFRNGLMLSILAARAQSWVMAEEKELDNQINSLDRQIKESIDLEHHLYTGLCSELDALMTERENVSATLYCGVHADDATNWAYPDCTPEFIGPLAAAIYTGTYNKVRLKAPLLEMNKAMVVKMALDLRVPLQLTWSCYKGEALHCGICPTCRSRRDAFTWLRRNNLTTKMDPTVYAETPHDVLS